MQIRVPTIFWLAILAICLSPCGFADSISAITQPGVYISAPGKACTASLKKSLQGGFMQLSIGRDHKHLSHVADDVTAFVWASPRVLIYSVSPVYGSPGVFMAKCDTPTRITTLVAPMNLDKAYPQGADYFEIKSISGHSVEYFYGDDVDKIDFAQLRSNKNLRQVELP